MNYSPYTSLRPELENAQGASQAAQRLELLDIVLDSNSAAEPNWQQFLTYLQHTWKVPCVSLHIHGNPPRMIQKLAENPQGLPPESLTAATDVALEKSSETEKPITIPFRDRNSEACIDVHAVPIRGKSETPRYGTLAVVTAPLPKELAASLRAQLKTQANLILEFSNTALQQNTSKNKHQLAASLTAEENPFDDLLLCNYSSVSKFGHDLASLLKSHFNCLEVGVGQVINGTVSIIGLSNQQSPSQKTPSGERLSQVMCECLDYENIVYAQNAPLTFGKAAQLPIHKQWSRASMTTNCLSIPIFCTNSEGKKEPKLILTLTRLESQSFTDEELSRLTLQTRLLGNTASLLLDARATISNRLLTNLRNRLTVAAKTPRGLALGIASITLCTLLLLPWHHSLVIKSRLASREGRTYTTPFEGRLKHIYVQPGEIVHPGQPLFEMDTLNLEAELKAARAEQNLHRLRIIDALNQRDAAKAAASQQLYQSTTLKINELEEQCANATILAEQAGVITAADGYNRSGEKLAFGALVIHVSPSDGKEVELLVDDHLLKDLHPGQTGWFASAGSPEVHRPLTIKRVEYSTRVEEGRNLVSAWAHLDTKATDLPLGTEGFAQVNTSTKPGWWILLYKPFVKLRWNLFPT